MKLKDNKMIHFRGICEDDQMSICAHSRSTHKISSRETQLSYCITYEILWRWTSQMYKNNKWVLCRLMMSVAFLKSLFMLTNQGPINLCSICSFGFLSSTDLEFKWKLISKSKTTKKGFSQPLFLISFSSDHFTIKDEKS